VRKKTALDYIYNDQNEIAEAKVTDDELIVRMGDGRAIHAPLGWFPFLINATPEQRQNFQIMGWLINWEEFDDGVSIEPLLLGLPKRNKPTDT
jgi:hypothetical protein